MPLAVVIAAEIGNEIMDRLYSGLWNWPDTLGDMAATWAWPIIFTLAILADRRLMATGRPA
jgi:hypothetical protein